MRKFVNDEGFIVYDITVEDIKKLGGSGICDACGKPAPKGFLVAVMNTYLDPDCYNNWKKTAKRFEEDRPIERKRELYYDNMLGPHGSECLSFGDLPQ